jgi:hypothetical protein
METRHSGRKLGVKELWKTSTVLFFLSARMLCGQQNPRIVMGMRIVSVTEQAGRIAIATTGARFELEGQETILCWQRIPRDRRVLQISFAQAVGPYHIQKKNEFSCTVSCQAGTLTFQGDSLVILRINKDTKISFQGFFRPAYHFEKAGKWISMDADGGFGIYPVERKSLSTPVFTKLPWGLNYTFAGGDEAWLSVFPPRPYNWNRAFAAIEHDGLPAEYTPAQLEGAGAYPSNHLIQAAAKHCKIYTLHAYIWQDAPEEVKERLTPILHTEAYAGHPQPWLTPKHVPLDMREFTRVRDEVHMYGMKLVVYLSPIYSSAPDIFAEMQRVLDEYKVDGLYFDGISMDFRKSYSVIRRAREILGDNRILYVHCSSDPLDDGRIYCPFIDTYADYILRGEAGVWRLRLDEFLRWTVSGHNISNAVGYWCYYGSNRQQGYDASTPKSGEYFDTVPTSGMIDAALRNKVFIWREGQQWSLAGSKEALAKFDQDYYSKVEQLRKSREK